MISSTQTCWTRVRHISPICGCPLNTGKLCKGCVLLAGLDISSCLKPSETVIATLQCKGFDGFPDFGESNNQKRTVSGLLIAMLLRAEPILTLSLLAQGLCSISLVSRPDAGHGRESEQHLRIIFDHTGTFRSMDAVEELCDCKVLCATTEKYDWTVNREQVTSLAVIDCETQLMGISSHTVDKMNLKKTHGFERPWYLPFPRRAACAPPSISLTGCHLGAGGGVSWLCAASLGFSFFSGLSLCQRKRQMLQVQLQPKSLRCHLQASGKSLALSSLSLLSFLGLPF
jgi:hypothetical protein